MSDRPQRNIPKFCYKEYNRTGEKLLKGSMEKISEEYIDEEIKIFRKLLIFFNEYELSLLFDIEDVESGIKEIKDLTEVYDDIHVKLKRSLGDTQYEDQYSVLYKEQMENINGWIKAAKLEIRRKKEENLDSVKKETFNDFLEKNEREKREKIVKCRIIYDNISERILDLEKRCSTDVKKLSDIDLLKEKDDLKSLNTEFNDILDRFTKLSEHDPNELHETNKYLEEIFERKKALRSSMELFKIAIGNEVLVRDVTEEKLKNASLLGIKLSKFQGYDSELDFYSFKSEFEKLIQPYVQSKLLPDYLKKNFLGGQALHLVREMDNLEEIWKRLKASYGSVETLMNIKLYELGKGTPLWKIKNEEKAIQSVLQLKNSMTELKELAAKHDIEHSLYHTSNLAKVFSVLGRQRQRKITEKLLGKNVDEEGEWDEIINFLASEIKLKEKMILYEPAEQTNEKSQRKKDESSPQGSNYMVSITAKKACTICEKDDHVPTITNRGNKIINYFACEKFAKMSCKERLEELKKKNLCFQCLNPGLRAGHKGRCFDKYKCPDGSHSKNSGLHVLVCDSHKNSAENLNLLQEYKEKCIEGKNEPHAEFSKNIDIAFHVTKESYEMEGSEKFDEMAIYMLQTIKIENIKFNIFFDNGCGDMVIRKSAVDVLERLGKAKNVEKGPLILGGVGDIKTICAHGRYQITLPLYDGKEIKLTGMCLEKLTSTFPTFLLGEAEKDLIKTFVPVENCKKLPKLPKYVGGDTDIMIGVQYLKYFPKTVYEMDNGLQILESPFENSDGSRGVVAGPHKSFLVAYKNGNNYTDEHVSSYLTDSVKIHRSIFKSSVHIRLTNAPKINENDIFSYQEEIRDDESSESEAIQHYPNKKESYVAKRVPKLVKFFENIEKAGTEVSYRCIRCRGCTECKKGEFVECISLQEEMEQGIIDKSVTVDKQNECVSAYLPFMCDPLKKLVTNHHIAEKIYMNQVKKLNSKSQKDKEEVIKAFQKLIDLGFIAKYDDLPSEEKQYIDASQVKYFIPWAAVWNTNSQSTPCRPVFNASCPTDSGYSLNDILPKGRNNLNKLVQIFIRWRIYECAFHTDIQKMYNTIRLDPKHWCYQLCLFANELDTDKKPDVHVIKTLIYGVRTSGNQAEKAVRETAKLCQDKYPRQNEIIQNDLYMDDCFSGENSNESAEKATDDLQIVLGKGGFHLKGITFTGFDPPDHLSNNDKQSVNVGGLKWFSKSDKLSLNIGELNFKKKVRGKKEPQFQTSIPDEFTRRDCAGRVGEIFDLIGRFVPLVVELKLDLHDLCTRKLDWDDYIPPDLIGKQILKKFLRWEKSSSVDVLFQMML